MIATRRTVLIGACSALAEVRLITNAHAALINPTSFSEQLLYCTMRITSSVQNGVKYGTGFIFNFKSGDKIVPALVTNKHVVANATQTTFKIHTSEDPPAPTGNQDILAPGESEWTQHPNSNVDLCCLPLGPVLNGMKKPAPFYRAIDSTLIPTENQLKELDAIEEVVMVGYPISLSDMANNYPVFRRGITASDLAVDFENKSIFVVDMACFPGSSGSPVFLYNSGSFSPKAGGLTVGTRAMFLGIMYATPVYSPEGKVSITEAPTTLQGAVSLTIPINLGYVVKAHEIDGLRDALFHRYKI